MSACVRNFGLILSVSSKFYQFWVHGSRSKIDNTDLKSLTDTNSCRNQLSDNCRPSISWAPVNVTSASVNYQIWAVNQSSVKLVTSQKQVRVINSLIDSQSINAHLSKWRQTCQNKLVTSQEQVRARLNENFEFLIAVSLAFGECRHPPTQLL